MRTDTETIKDELAEEFLAELDGFDGVVIVTTNLFENYDPALLRRIQRHIKFRLPDASIRRELFALHFPNPERVKADYAVLAVLPEADGLDMLTNKYERKFSCPPTIVPPPARGCVLLQICST